MENAEADFDWGALEDSYVDDTSGAVLRPELVQEARAEEVRHTKDVFKVYVPVPEHEATRPGSKLIGTRWVDTNKGDDVRPDYRSRLVAQEVKRHKVEEAFAATHL